MFSIFLDPDSRSVASSDVSVADPAASSGTSATAPGSETASLSASAAGQKEPPSLHPEFQFFDPTGKFYCKIYFAEQFRLFRAARLAGDDREARF